MNRQSLTALLAAEHVRTDAYSIDGTIKDDAMCMVVVWAAGTSSTPNGDSGAER